MVADGGASGLTTARTTLDGGDTPTIREKGTHDLLDQLGTALS